MKLELKQLRKHFQSLKENGSSEYKANDVKSGVEESLEDFATQVIAMRLGHARDTKGRQLAANDISLPEALKLYYGADLDSWLKSMGIYQQSLSISDAADVMGFSNLNSTELEELLIKHTKEDFGAHTGDINKDFRFVIPELILNAIRIGYDEGAFHPNWIASTLSISQREIKMPQILRGDGVSRRIEEGGTIPFGSVKFGQKTADVFKVGTGFKITDELIDASSIDLMFQFLQEVGVDMSIGADTEAMRVLVSGEQTDGSESAPVVGTTNGTTFAYKDFKRVTTRMRRLKNDPNRIISQEDDGIDIDTLPEFQGFDGPTVLSRLRTIIGVRDVLDHDVHITPADQVMFINTARAMAKLKYKGMMVERRRNPQTQEEEMFVSDHVGFAILRRDARVLLDKTVTIAASPFPSYMDIDTRITESFEDI